MKQLKMYLLSETVLPAVSLPTGFSITKYADEKDIEPWIECCSSGNLIDEGRGVECFHNVILNHKYVNPTQDVFFLDYYGKHIGTATGYVRNVSSEKVGVIHMVGVKKDYRGSGLSTYVVSAAVNHLREASAAYILLTTDDDRLGAIKTYLKLGFQPVEYDLGMQDRWERVLESVGVESVDMLYDDASVYKAIYRRSKAPFVKVGVFGAGRGQSVMRFCQQTGNAKLVSVCDGYEPALNDAKEKFGETEVKYYKDFDEFIKSDIDLVVLANYANEHAPYAIRCLEAGKNVLSEVMPVQTLHEAVELIEAVERSGKIYAYAENYCYMPAPKTMRKYLRQGNLGQFEYAEGEYMHNCEPIWDDLTRCDPTHWRNTMSAFFYCTHSVGPLIHMSGLRPVKVSGFEGPFNNRMFRMGAKAGAYALEIITLENGAVVKSLHGVGPSKNSIWYSVYGEKGRMESAREDDLEKKSIQTCYANIQPEGKDYGGDAELIQTEDSLTEEAGTMGHGGSDYYVMYHIIQAIRGNRNAEIIDVYEALDFFLPGLFGYFSALEGGIPIEIPNLRNREEREKWRNDRRCTDSKDCSNQIIPSYSKGTPAIPNEVYEKLKSRKQASENNT